MKECRAVKGQIDILPQEDGLTDFADTFKETRGERNHGVETVTSPEYLEETGTLSVGGGAGTLGILDLYGPFVIHEVGDALDAVGF
jgi:hypothetical protein